jgi:myo-inositol-1(or 4)-monophosphatase
MAPLWVVDPIDGTANFARRLPLWCISIGLYADGAPVLGVIHNPMTDELHAAANGRGATLNGTPIRRPLSTRRSTRASTSVFLPARS